MNQARRKELEKARDIIEAAKNEEEDAYENLPDSLQYSEKGQAMEDAISSLDNAMAELDEAINN